MTCYGEKVKNANCPKDQYMVVKIASFRGLLGTNKCGLSDDYSCEVDVTCLVKKKCDGLHECSFTVDDSFVSDDQCRGLSNYVYFEYQCIDTVQPFDDLCGMYSVKYIFMSWNFTCRVTDFTEPEKLEMLLALFKQDLKYNDYSI